MQSMDTEMKNKKTQLEDIAEALGLSKSTVSRAISGKGRVSAETRERVMRCIEEMHYTPNMIAKSLSESKTYNIGVVIPMDSSETEAPFFQTCLMGISKECAIRDYDAIIVGTDKNDLSQLKRVVGNRKADGFIIMRPVANGEMEKLLRESGLPFVTVGQSVDSSAVTVDSNHKDGCRELTSYLLMSSPADKIGLIIGSMEHTVNKSRFAGFMKAFEAVHRAPSQQMIFTGIDSDLQFSKAAAALLKNEPDCIICGDDVLCIKLLNILNEMGRRIPDDIRVASFYNSSLLDVYQPPITSLIYDSEELGSVAAAKIIEMLGSSSSNESALLSYEMLVRRSTQQV
ncbi:transcriptional regulator, LacI family [Ruminococcus sp. YE71]|nr:transcriptional regulator, LacI family [Ruminococcus sp. YE78]SFW16296.1 transcriptional regulator, LacI family [Ruminococcus sp. YE71]